MATNVTALRYIADEDFPPLPTSPLNSHRRYTVTFRRGVRPPQTLVRHQDYPRHASARYGAPEIWFLAERSCLNKRWRCTQLRPTRDLSCVAVLEFASDVFDEMAALRKKSFSVGSNVGWEPCSSTLPYFSFPFRFSGCCEPTSVCNQNSSSTRSGTLTQRALASSPSTSAHFDCLRQHYPCSFSFQHYATEAAKMNVFVVFVIVQLFDIGCEDYCFENTKGRRGAIRLLIKDSVHIVRKRVSVFSRLY